MVIVSTPVQTPGAVHEDHEQDALLEEIATRVGTPVYVYNADRIRAQWQRLNDELASLDHRICYAVKANSNLAVLALFAELDTGFDIVSGGELERVLTAGGRARDVVFSGVGKSTADIDFALKQGIGCFNVESASELERLEARAQLLYTRAPVAVRVNPDVDAQTHPYISTGLKTNKFGVSPSQAKRLYQRAHASSHLDVTGIACHIGSQISETAPYRDALNSLITLVDELADDGIKLDHLDLGGGFGVRYASEDAFDTTGFRKMLEQQLEGRQLRLDLEPGRFLVADSGVLLCRVEYLKPTDDENGRDFAVVDAAMNDLIRPALYQAWHRVRRVGPPSADAAEHAWDVVGPVCESGDFLAQERRLALAEGDLVAVHSCGAYGMVQSSNYNTRNRAAEVLVESDTYRIVRQRETVRDQLRLELAGLNHPVSATARESTENGQ